MNYGFDQSEEPILSDLDYVYACESFLFPKIRDFNPEVILISCGFDSALGDPVGGVGLTPAGYAWMTHGLMKICPKVIALLEGGYDLEALAKSSEAVIEAMFVQGQDEKGFREVLKRLGCE